MNREQAKTLNVMAAGVLQAVDAAGSLGAPGGILYAGLMSSGCSFENYEMIMGRLQSSGLVKRSGECYTLTDKGVRLNTQITAAIQAHQAAA